MNNILDLIGEDFNPTPYENTDFTFFNSVPSTEEVRDKNANMMHSALVNNGFKIRTMYKQCTDGEEYEIIEIRGPKASGFFMLKTMVSSTASDFLYTSAKHKHLLRKR